MAKTIVEKTELATDPKLSIIKAFRLATKQISQDKTAIANTTEQNELDLLQAHLITLRAKRRSLAALAYEQGFRIWVNDSNSGFSGKTGHTYEKDYKVSPDEQNDWDAFQARINRPAEPQIAGLPSITEILADEQNGEEDNGDAEEGSYESGEA